MFFGIATVLTKSQPVPFGIRDPFGNGILCKNCGIAGPGSNMGLKGTQSIFGKGLYKMPFCVPVEPFPAFGLTIKAIFDELILVCEVIMMVL